MHIFIDVANDRITLDSITVPVDTSSLKTAYACVHYVEGQQMEVRTISGEIGRLPSGSIPSILPLIESAYEAIAAREEEAQLIASSPKFTTTKVTVGEFNVYKVFAAEAGALALAGDGIDIDRTQSRRVSMVTKGSRKYEPTNGRFPAVTLTVGGYNLDLPDMQASDKYKITSLEPNTEYHCVSRSDLRPFSYTRVTVSAGGQIVLPAGRNLFVGSGRIGDLDSPAIVPATINNRTFDVVGSSVFGLIFW